MKNRNNSFVYTSRIRYLLVLLCLVIYGCAGTWSIVPEERRLSLIETGENQKVFKYGQFSAEYSYSLTGDTMNLTGQAYYRGGVDSLDIYFMFLDTTGKVISKKLVYSTGFRSVNTRDKERVFNEKLVVPDGAVGISFNYSAQQRSSHR